VSVDAGDGTPPVLLDLGTGCRMLGESLLRRFFPGEPIIAGVQPRDTHDPPHAPYPHPTTRVRFSAFVTHLHFDHVQGLPFFAPALRADVHMDVFGPVQDEPLGEVFGAFVQPPYFPVGLSELPAELTFSELADGATVEVGSARVHAREVPHVGRTLGYRVAVGGVTVAYLSDHQAPERNGRVLNEVSDAALDLCGDADLLVHDAQYTDAEFAAKAHWGHSTVAYAVEVARRAGVKRLALFHHDPTHDDDMLDRLGEETRKHVHGAFDVVVAAEGTQLSVGAAGADAIPLSPLAEPTPTVSDTPIGA
jgi:phosphoribosyl 1,2-cyclic phosphodiesterase